MSERGKQIDAARSGRLLIERENNRIIGRDPSNVSRLLIAAESDSFSMKVSMAGIDVTMADNDQLIFNSNQNIFKIVESGTATTPSYTVTSTVGQWVSSNAGGPIVITHNLGYVPGVIAYVLFDDQYVLAPTTFQSISGPNGVLFQRVLVNVDSTYLYLGDTTITNGSVTTTSGGGLAMKYYLLQESAT